MWLTISVAWLIAILFTVPIVWVAGWRRPGAGVDESALLSGMFLFVLVFVATWALAGWLAPWGPEFSGVSWLLVLIGAAFVTLLVLVAAPVNPRYSSAEQTSSSGEPLQVEQAAEGLGVLFWMLVVLLITIGVIGNTRVGGTSLNERLDEPPTLEPELKSVD
jgi:hypothetical protein